VDEDDPSLQRTRRGEGHAPVTDLPAQAGPLKGLRVLDLTSVLMGPYATQLSAELGADVIKVESEEGDIVRQIGNSRNKGMPGMFLTVNRGKRSIVLDLKSKEGRDHFLELAATSDVLIYNIRPQAMERLRLTYDELASVKPDIIYVGVSGYGEGGRYRGLPAYDDLIQGASGIAALFANEPGDEPRYVPLAIADRMVGLHAVSSILAAIIHRDRTGEGQKIDIPMFETMASVVLGDHLGGLTFDPPLDGGGYDRLLAPDRKPQRTKDGYICALIYNDNHWRAFFKLIGKEDRLDDERFLNHTSRAKNIKQIYREIAAIFLTKTTQEWTDLLRDVDIPVMPLHDVNSLLHDPHLVESGFFEFIDHPTEGRLRAMRVPASWSKTQPPQPRFAPRLGENSDEILEELSERRRGRRVDKKNLALNC
jgi:crotonobetainyl-CoA:carnitine CoA-transferase CaiB-like acyl-CoA transferase